MTQRDNDNSFSFKITKHYGILSRTNRGWTKELNLVSWNEREPKFDLRDWDDRHEKMGRGITLTLEEIQGLYDNLSLMPEIMDRGADFSQDVFATA